MSLKVESLTNAFEESDAEKRNAIMNQISPEFTEEGVGANLESLNEQTSTLTQLLTELIHDNLKKVVTMANCRADLPPTVTSLSSETIDSKILPKKPFFRKNVLTITIVKNCPLISVQ